MTREEALESGIREAWGFVWAGAKAPQVAASYVTSYLEISSPDELEGFAVGLQLVAVEVAEIARKRREDAASCEVDDDGGPDLGMGFASSDSFR